MSLPSLSVYLNEQRWPAFPMVPEHAALVGDAPDLQILINHGELKKMLLACLACTF
jgi:hypothetical protein